MKRLLEHEKVKWLYDGEKPKCNIMLTFEEEEIPQDLDLTGYTFGVYNILWPDCYGQVSKFDEYGNIIKLKFPKYFQQFAFSVRKQTYQSIVSSIEQQTAEDDIVVSGKQIWYDNFIGLNPAEQQAIRDSIYSAWDICRSKGFEPNIGAKELVQHIVKFLAERQKEVKS